MVYSEQWHTVLVLPKPHGVEEWSYGEKVWFMEGRHNPWTAVRALFWPHAGVLLVTRASLPYPQREPDAVGHVWKLRLTPEGLVRLRAYLEASRASPVPLRVEDGSTWYAARQPYDSLNNCHHFIARGLRQAGLPIRLWPSVFSHGFWRQLDRLAPREHPPAR